MLENKIAIVTGASRGIGQGVALALGKQGATVIGTATTQTGADAITENFKAESIHGKGYVLDVAQPPMIHDFIGTVISDYDAPNILINNAGITRDNLMLRMKDEEWNDIIDTNLNSVYHLSKACLKGMLKQRWGRIINMTSVVACTGNAGQANYTAAKAGVIAFSKSLAQEIASRNITVNCIAPGFIETEMTQKLNEQQREYILAKIPMQRIGHIDDIAAAVNFLVSPGADYITGETLHVNGGMYMS